MASRLRHGHANQWEPLLHGVDAERAETQAQAVADRLERRLDEQSDASLAGGTAGHGLLLAYAGRAEPAGRATDAGLRALAQQRLRPGLFDGFTGVAWAAAHLLDQGADVEPRRSFLDHVTDVLTTFVSQRPWRRPYDLVEGLSGIAVFALERPPHGGGDALLAEVAARLTELADRDAHGVVWRVAEQMIPDHVRQALPGADVNLGLAHGIPGAIAALAGAVRAGVVDPGVLDCAVAWLLAHEEQRDDGHSYFGDWIVPGRRNRPARTAWCYGDPGIAAALLLAGRAMDDSEYDQAAVRVARRAAARPAQRTGVDDAGICHGAAGLGHCFNRLAQATGDDQLAAAAVAWILRALSLLEAENGDGTRDDSLLEGAAGVALALLAAASATAPAWDRMLMLSLAR